MTEPVIAVAQLGKAFRTYRNQWSRVASWMGAAPRFANEHWALRGVTFEIARGEAVGLVGSNGAGKSTLLKVLVGVLKPTEGTVSTRGRVAALLELGIGFSGELTGRQNVVLSSSLMGMSSTEIAGKIHAVEAFADIGEYFDRPLRTYSTGMAMRVAFAVATAFDPEILIIDEALAVGDVSFQAKCFERLHELKSRHCTLLFVSHAVESIVRHCTRALFLDSGRLVMDGAPREVSNAYLAHMLGPPGRRSDEPARGESVMFAADAVDRFATRPGYRQDERRWGEGGAQVIDFALEAASKLYPAEISADEELRIVMKVRFDADVECPVFGLLIKTIDGVFLYGTNSTLAGGARQAPAIRDEIRICEFGLRPAVNTGSFLISLGVSAESPGAITALDRRYDAILINVRHPAPFWGIADLGSSFQVLPAA